MKSALLTAVIIAGTTSSFVYSQEYSQYDTLPAPPPEEIIECYIHAIGGRDALYSVNDRVMKCSGYFKLAADMPFLGYTETEARGEKLTISAYPNKVYDYLKMDYPPAAAAMETFTDDFELWCDGSEVVKINESYKMFKKKTRWTGLNNVRDSLSQAGIDTDDLIAIADSIANAGPYIHLKGPKKEKVIDDYTFNKEIRLDSLGYSYLNSWKGLFNGVPSYFVRLQTPFDEYDVLVFDALTFYMIGKLESKNPHAPYNTIRSYSSHRRTGGIVLPYTLDVLQVRDTYIATFKWQVEQYKQNTHPPEDVFRCDFRKYEK